MCFHTHKTFLVLEPTCYLLIVGDFLYLKLSSLKIFYLLKKPFIKNIVQNMQVKREKFNDAVMEIFGRFQMAVMAEIVNFL